MHYQITPVVYPANHSHTHLNMACATHLAGLDSSWCRTLHPHWASGKSLGCPGHWGRSRRNHQSDRTPGCWRRPARTFKDLKGLLERQHRQSRLWCLLIATRECVCQNTCVLPVGDGNKGGSMVLTGLPGLFKGKQIFSNPVTSWAVPLPPLRGQERLAGYGI